MKPPTNLSLNARALPVLNLEKCLSDIVNAYTEYATVAEQEKTKRRSIEAWEKATLADINTKRDVLIHYLNRSFDERANNFHALFQRVDQAMVSGDNQQLGLVLNSIVDLAKSGPFKDIADLSTVKTLLADPDHVWEI
jgi:predicted ribonuclease toxin of YeeF-YezG toxin-antitoxin module